MARDPLRLLGRPDKWYLATGGGDGLLWAPPFPRWLDVPGFWDEAHLFQYAVGPLFTVSFLVDGEELPARVRGRRWTPAALTAEYTLGALRAQETRCAPGGALASEWTVRNPTGRAVALDVVVWTALDGADCEAGDVEWDEHALSYAHSARDRRGHEATVEAALSLTPAAQSHAAYRAEGSAGEVTPRFEITPFFDRWDGALHNERHLGGIGPEGVVYLGLHRRVRVPPRGSATFSAAVTLALSSSADGAGDRLFVRPSVIARRRWERFFSSVPRFTCSDPYLDRYWWYRWYGLRLCALNGGSAPKYRFPTVCEGIGFFHVPISYSAPCHIRELRWLADPDWARGVLRNFLLHQKPDGSLHGRLYADHLEGTDFYHGDWGGALAALDAVHPDLHFQTEVYTGLSRYADWLIATRDADGTGMIDILDQYETGQEFMSRYQAVDPRADRYGWENRIRLKGVDVTVYAYRLFRMLERFAAGPNPAAVERWRTAAERTARAVRERMWEPDAEMFFDVNPATGGRTGVKAAVSFYPYLTDLAGPEHLAGLERHLFDPDEFWTPFPVPSSSADDPRFSPDAEWQGKRHSCPWNGRVWPMTNAHVVDALAAVTRDRRPGLAPHLAHLVRRFFRMLTDGGRADRPNCYEHYHPLNGRPSVYRGINDYQHSWVNDLIVSHVMGILPQPGGEVVIHPLPLGIARAELDGVVVRGRRLRVAVRGSRFEVWVNGRRAARGRVGEPLALDGA